MARSIRGLTRAAFIILIGGCVPGPPRHGAESHPVLSDDSATRPDDVDNVVHDFGSVLARGQTLQHEFTITNDSDKPVRLLEGVALTPCCSTIGPIPQSIPPGEVAKVPTQLKVGRESGRKRATFIVRIGGAEPSSRRFTLEAGLSAEVELRPDDGAMTVQPLGQEIDVGMTLLCRRLADAGRSLPDTLDVPPSISARFVGPVEEERSSGGLIEASRRLIVHLPASMGVGQHEVAIQFRWPDGSIWSQSLGWRVIPRIQAVPSGLVIKRIQGPSSWTIGLWSSDRPFHVTKVEGAIPGLDIRKRSTAEARRHALRVEFDPSKVTATTTLDLSIHTDHPDQKIVPVSVLILP